MKKAFPLFLITILLLANNVYSQNLPRWLTEEERLQLPSYLLRNDGIRGTEPPEWTPRASAEWEEIQGLLITWTDYTSILKQIVDVAQEECPVYIVCSDSNSVKNSLTGSGIPLTNLKFLDFGYNSIWCRDYGQWNIYKNDVEDLSLVDWIYNRPRPKDDSIPKQLAAATGLDIYQTLTAPNDLVNTGGNFMVDGHGTAFSSKLIMEDNGPGNDWDVTVKTESEIDTILKKYMGINRYILMETLPYDEIHHIDMHMKLLDEETILVGQFPAGVGDGPQIEENIQYVQSNFLNCYGRPYKIVYVPMPPSTTGQYVPNAAYRTYTNSVFVNKSVILPTYREEYDTTAIRIYKENLPGYKIYPIDCDDGGNAIINALGAIHCITKEIAVSDPIWIDHSPLQNVLEDYGPFPVEARIKTPTGVSSATLYWTNDTAIGFNAVSMQPALNDTFYAEIPLQTSNVVYYYINAESNSGRSVSKPLTAPDGWWKFEISNLLSAQDVQHPSLEFYSPYPNPAYDNVSFGLWSPVNISGLVIVRNALGEVVTVLAEGSIGAGNHKWTLNTQNIPSGLYFAEVITGNGVLSKKFIVQH